ncbi:MAG: efflux RND transporter periplasmic adaptor subunit, partial [Desulfuromonas sp.]|nr:efflux RND transporter periplasmic adaptor subunit [Desulfuromonas sp.]
MTPTLLFLRSTTIRLASILPILVLFIFTGCDKAEKVTAEAPAVEVVAITIEPQTVPAVFSFIAQIQSSHQVDVTARVNGFLDKISYSEGESVRQGQVLFQLDQKPFVAAADAAKAEMEVRKSQLWTAKASLDRVRPLAEQNAASKSDLDNAEGNYKSVEAALQQAKAKYDKALLDLSYTTIIAPFSGVAGQSLMREGS